MSLFVIGAGIGFSIAFIGGLIEYWITLRSGANRARHQPSCLLFTVGGLAIAGIVAMIASAVINGGIGEALIMGAGVLAGFYAGFIIAFGLWFILERK